MKALQMFFQCWLELTKHQRYRDKWLTDETYFRAIKAQFPTLESLGFDRGKMNKAISTHGGSTMDDFTESNQTGRFRRQAYGYDPFGTPKRKVMGYYVTAPGGVVERPPDGKKSFLSLLQDQSIGDHYSVARGVPEIVDLMSEIVEQSLAKRKADAKLAVEEEAKKPKHGSAAAKSPYVKNRFPQGCTRGTRWTELRCKRCPRSFVHDRGGYCANCLNWHFLANGCGNNKNTLFHTSLLGHYWNSTIS